MRGRRGDEDALDVVWCSIDVGLLGREGHPCTALLHSTDESGPRWETAGAALADLREMNAWALA